MKAARLEARKASLAAVSEKPSPSSSKVPRPTPQPPREEEKAPEKSSWVMKRKEPSRPAPTAPASLRRPSGDCRRPRPLAKEAARREAEALGAAGPLAAEIRSRA